MGNISDLFETENMFSRGVPQRVYWDKENSPARLPSDWATMSPKEKEKYLEKGNLWNQFLDVINDTSDKIKGKKFSEEVIKQADSVGMTPREYARRVYKAYPESAGFRYSTTRILPPAIGESPINPYVPKDSDPNYTGPRPDPMWERAAQSWNYGPSLPVEDVLSSSIQARFLKGDDVNPDKGIDYDNKNDGLEETLLKNAYNTSKEVRAERLMPYSEWKNIRRQYIKDTYEKGFDSAYETFLNKTKSLPASVVSKYLKLLDKDEDFWNTM